MDLKSMEIPPGLDVMEDGRPFFFEGGKTGILLIHGFTGTTSSMKPMGEYMASRGLTVLGPRLPGHGTDVRDMGRHGYKDWMATVETALAELQGMCDFIFVSGLSMGAVLTLYLGEQHSDSLAGIIPISGPVRRLVPGAQRFLLPLVPVLKYVVRTMPGPGNDVADPQVTETAYEKLSTNALHELIKLLKYVDNHLDRVTSPIRVFHSRQDHVVPPLNADYIMERVSSSDKELIWLENSYHVCTLDFDKDEIFRKTFEFIGEITG